MDSEKRPQLQHDPVVGDEVELQALVEKDPADFDAWRSLITKIERTSFNDITRICLVYDSFLSEFPLCYGYWKKYADHKARLSTIDKAVEVYERAVQSTAYSVGLWVNYCSFSMLSFEDPVDVRRLFERGMSFVGKDYLCHLLWDKYIAFEYSQKQWSRLAHIYIRTLKFPTKKLSSYYESFKRLAAIWEAEIKYQDNGATKVQSEAVPDFEFTEVKAYGDDEISSAIKAFLDPSAGPLRSNELKKYLSSGEYYYQKASHMDAEIHCFESGIRRPYFHAKPLDYSQLENWHHYLDFVEMQGDFDWTVKLYERCLIPCANYPEFWIRYVEHVETKGGREIANLALVRAAQSSLKKVPGIHLFCARFKEQIGDIIGARAAFFRFGSDLSPDFIECVAREANMEKRVGNIEAASAIYENALELAKEKQNSQILSVLYAHFARFKYMVTGSIDASRDVLIKGIQHLPHCKLLLEGLIRFEMMHGGPRQINVLDSIVAHALAPGPDGSQGLSNYDCEDISKLFLEFVDFCGTVHEIKKAWNRHRKLFPHLMRPTSSYKYLATENNMLDNAKVRRHDILVPLLHRASGDESPHGSDQNLMLNHTPSLQKTPDIQSDQAIADQAQPKEANEGIKETLKHVQASEGEEKSNGRNFGVHDSMHEGGNGPYILHTLPEYLKVANHNLIQCDSEQQDELRPPSLENLSINPRDDDPQLSTPSASRDSNAPEPTSQSNGNSRLRNGSDTNGISSSSHLTGMQTDMPTQAHTHLDYGPPNTARDPSSLQIQTETQVLAQTHPQTYSQQVVPSNSAFPNNAVNGQNWHLMNSSGQAHLDSNLGFQGYIQAQQPQQWQVPQQSQYPTPEMQSQMFMGQGYPNQPQTWQNPLVQQANGAQNQYQVAAGQVYATGAHVWSGQNMQQQSFVSATQPQSNAQPVSHPQTQAYQYSMQINEQHAYMQNYQGVAPQLWYYYQQQYQQYQLQQQQQQQLQQQQQPQQQISQQSQMWSSNYHPQQTIPVQYSATSQYGQEDGQQPIDSQAQRAISQHTGELSVPVYPHPPQEDPSN